MLGLLIFKNLRGDWYEDQTGEWHYGWLGQRYVFLNDMYAQKRAGGGGFKECFVMRGPNGESEDPRTDSEELIIRSDNTQYHYY